MTSILASISGQFNKSIILGTFLPAALYVLLGAVFLIPLSPTNISLIEILIGLSNIWDLLIVTFIIILLTGLLYNLNIPIIRFFEGYPWQSSMLGQWRTNQYKAQFKAIQAQRSGAHALQGTLDNATRQRYQRELTDWSTNTQHLTNREFPRSEAFILPTRLGNVIASFESYPVQQYGMGSVTLWPRLIAKIDPGYAAVISDSKTSFDFMVNSSVLSTVLALLTTATGFWYGFALVSIAAVLWWILKIAVMFFLAYLFYLGSINRATAWGATVKSAFDLYRWDLLKQLGYTSLPATMAEERALWGDISRQMIVGDQDTVRLPQYDPGQTVARSYPPVEKLIVNRSVTSMSDAEVQVILQVFNQEDQYDAPLVILTEKLPEDFEYKWNSATNKKTGGLIAVSGSNPYTFEIGDIEPGKNVVVTYTMLKRKG